MIGARRLLFVLSLTIAIEGKAVLVNDFRSPSVGGSMSRLDATLVFDFEIRLPGGTEVVFETRNLTSAADPVLHLLVSTTANGLVREVARDDDGAGGVNARITYTPPSDGTYILILRATWNGYGGTADLYRDGRLFWGPLPVGGAFRRLEKLRPGEVLTTVPLPRAPSEHALYLLDSRGRIFERHRSEVTQSAVKEVTAPRDAAIAMVAPFWPDVPGPIALIRNDGALAGQDPDRDGLGTELEFSLGTCSSLTGSAGGFDCRVATDARDTDGDGLDDAVEVFGNIGSAPYQRLPRWGADPRHKDVFIEVDFMARSRNEPRTTMSVNVARQIAAVYGDPGSDGRILRNPDGGPGIHLHFDLGMSPRADDSDADQVLYGEWGGHNRVPPVCSGDVCIGAEAGAVWREQMHRNRHGLFHYVLGYPGGSGQSPPLVVATALPLNDSTTAAHEFGHTLGLGHSGPFGVSGIDTNCKPNYPSLMNYTYHAHGRRVFSDGQGRAPLLNTRLIERRAILSPASERSASYLRDLRTLFFYDVDMDKGDVDWNRDGVISSAPVRAYANESGAGCEFTKYNKVPIRERSTRTPALARADGITAIFFIDTDRRIGFSYTLGSLACPEPAIEGCGSAPFQRFIDETWNRDIDAFDVYRIVENGGPKFLIVYRTLANKLFEVILDTGLATGTPRRIETIAVPIEDLSLAGSDDTVYLAYKGFGGAPMLKTRTRGTWAEDELVRDATGTLLPRIAAGSSPSLLEANVAGVRTLFGVFPAAEGRLRLYTFDGGSRRWTRSPWTLTTRSVNACEPEFGEETSLGKPALAWTPMPADSPLPGRLHLFYLGRCEAHLDSVRSRMLIGVRNAAGDVVLRMGLPAHHQNVWYTAYGFDLLYDQGADSNLRALVSRKLSTGPGQLEFRTKADGILDFELRNWSDWEVLRIGICRTLVPPGADAIRCPAWLW